MSEEEIINRLKERIKIDRSMRLNVESDFDRFCEEECQAIEGLIDLYNKEKERNMNLELENIGLKENRRIAVEEIQEEYYISKDKIREIIKGLDKRVIENSEINYFAYLTVGEALSFKRFLEKELLEEE